MTNTATSIQELVAQFQKDLAQAISFAEYAIANKDSVLVKGLIVADRDMRYAIEENHLQTAIKILTESLTHAAWTKYFESINLSKCVTSDVYWKAKANYTYDNPESRKKLSNIHDLKPFTVENIEAFNAQYLTVNEAAMNKAVIQMLWQTGEFRKRSTEYKPRLTFKGALILVADKARIERDQLNAIAEMLLALEYYQGKETPSTRIGEIRALMGGHHPKDTEIQILEGVSIILKSSGSLELRLDKSIVALLNSKLPATA